jgi:hypothetical protein
MEGSALLVLDWDRSSRHLSLIIIFYCIIFDLAFEKSETGKSRGAFVGIFISPPL